MPNQQFILPFLRFQSFEALSRQYGREERSDLPEREFRGDLSSCKISIGRNNLNKTLIHFCPNFFGDHASSLFTSNALSECLKITRKLIYVMTSGDFEKEPIKVTAQKFWITPSNPSWNPVRENSAEVRIMGLLRNSSRISDADQEWPECVLLNMKSDNISTDALDSFLCNA